MALIDEIDRMLNEKEERLKQLSTARSEQDEGIVRDSASHERA